MKLSWADSSMLDLADHDTTRFYQRTVI